MTHSGDRVPAAIVRASQGEAIPVAGIEHLFKLTGANTAGLFGLEEFVVPPDTLGARPHIHWGHDEYFYVLTGELTVATDAGEVLLRLATVRPQDSANIDCPVLVCVGSEDPIAPFEQRRAFADEMQAAGVDWQLIMYGGAEHAFHLPPVNADGSLSTADAHEQPVPGVQYHHRHAPRSWRAILDLLDEAFGPPVSSSFSSAPDAR